MGPQLLYKTADRVHRTAPLIHRARRPITTGVRKTDNDNTLRTALLRRIGRARRWWGGAIDAHALDGCEQPLPADRGCSGAPLRRGKVARSGGARPVVGVIAMRYGRAARQWQWRFGLKPAARWAGGGRGAASAQARPGAVARAARRSDVARWRAAAARDRWWSS